MRIDAKHKSPLDIFVRPIERDDLGRIVLRCWPPEPGTIERIFDEQGTIGVAAWHGDRCVGLLHCYRVSLPDWRCDYLPAWSRWFNPNTKPESCRVPARELGLRGDAWLHACFHVGRTRDAAAHGDDPDRTYFGRGIGTAMARRSVQWARDHGYVAVVAPGAPQRMREFAIWTGHLPWTTYAKLGFEAAADPPRPDVLPGWARGDSPPQVMREVAASLAAGRAVEDFYDRLMVLRLR